MVITSTTELHGYCSLTVFIKMGYSRPLFLYFRLFKTVGCKQMFNINFANDSIQTVDLLH